MKKQLTKSVAYHNWKIWTFPLHLPVEIISDSLSVLTMLEKGPCSQTHVLGNHMWNAVADIAQFTTGGIHFAHVFSHAGVECNDEADELAKEGIEAEIVDLRTIRPMDTETVVRSIMKTGRCVAVEEGWPQSGVTAEIGMRIMEAAFDYLGDFLERLERSESFKSEDGGEVGA